MGQATSTPGNTTQELTRREIIKYFKIQCALTLRSTPTSSPHISLQEFSSLLSDHALDGKFKHAVELLYEGCKRLGDYPFESNPSEVLSTDSLISCIVLFTKKYTRFIDIDYSVLCFMLLAREKEHTEKSVLDEKLIGEYDVFPLEVTELFSVENSPELVVPHINWNKSYNHFNTIEMGKYQINAEDLLHLITLFLVLSNEIEQDWNSYEYYALALLKNFNINLTKTTVAKYNVTYSEYTDFIMNFLPKFNDNFKSLFSRFGPNRGKFVNPKVKEEITKKRNTFKGSKLVNGAFVAIASLIFTNVQIDSISPSSLIKLYSGSESGFSLRSLELKIFKWLAPTLVVVSGKRLKRSVSNKRYEMFESLYPRYFRNYNLQNWQQEGEKITYLVYVNSPWKMSNKTNFGDRSNVIVCLLPKIDYYLARRDELIYFNNLGFGLGFGNSQPILKNSLKKLLPGNVSLTIDPNLEFSVFRHLVSTADALTYFAGSNIVNEDFEDRFTITDLEVWGVGTDKELAEQLKSWEWENKQAEARKSVNLKSMDEDRAFLEMVGLVGGHGGGSMA